MVYETELNIARAAAREAGEHIRAIYETATDDEMAIDRKNDGSPLTRADVEANAIIVDKLRRFFSTDGILTEEAEDNPERLQKERVWIIDPLDGTKEFLKRNGEFTVNVALAVANRPVVGAVYVPAKDEMYFAAEDSGAWAQMSSDAKPAPLHVSKVADLPQMVLAASRSHAGEKIKQMIEKAGFREVASRGSSLKGCMVASGQADVYCRFGPTNEWDICAMHAVLAEAGGTLTHVSGGEMLYNQAATLNQGFIASNGVAHDALLNLSATL